jgi:putative endonuclease
MPTERTRELGSRGEELAAQHFLRLGYRILARNHRTRWGELDLIVADARTLVFCEVKTRRLGSASPFEGLRDAQRRRLRRMAAAWLQTCSQRPRTPELRFDAIGVTIDAAGRLVAIEHLEGAF